MLILGFKSYGQTYKITDSTFNKGDYLRTYDIIFDFNKPIIRPKSYKWLDAYADFLKQNPNLIIKIKMHRDSRGSDSYSTCLTCRRAKSIAQYLMRKGIQAERLLPIGMGEDEPITLFEIDSLTNDTISRQVLTETYINSVKVKSLEKYEELHAKNRRIEFVILSTDFVEKETLQLTFLDSLHGQFSSFSVDNFGNIYTTNKDVVVKHNSNLDTLFSSSLKSLLPTTIESSKSFRVLLFDKERGVVSFLDNTLTDVKGDIDLADLDVLQTVLVCESFNGNSFWVLDEGGQQLLKVNQNLDIITRVDNLNFLFKDRASPIQMFEHNDELVIHFPDAGVATFDVFGTYLHFYPVSTQCVDLKHDYLFALQNQSIQVFGLPLMDDVATLTLPKVKIKSFKIINQKLYLHTDSSLLIYSVNLSSK